MLQLAAGRERKEGALLALWPATAFMNGRNKQLFGKDSASFEQQSLTGVGWVQSVLTAAAEVERTSSCCDFFSWVDLVPCVHLRCVRA